MKTKTIYILPRDVVLVILADHINRSRPESPPVQVLDFNHGVDASGVGLTVEVEVAPLVLEWREYETH